MGGASGKLIIQHPTQDPQLCERATPLSHSPCDPQHPSSKSQPLEKETASKLVNGDANAMSHIPPIDADLEPTNEQITEAVDQPTENHHSESNGTATPTTPTPTTIDTDDMSPTDKKHKGKNPITWMKRRLSRKSVSRHASEDTTEDQAKPTEKGDDLVATSPLDDPTAKKEVEDVTEPTKVEIEEAANSLVEEVFTSVNAEAVASAPEHSSPHTSMEESQLKTVDVVEESHTEAAALPVEEVAEPEPESPSENLNEMSPCSPTPSCQPEMTTPVSINGNHTDMPMEDELDLLNENNTNSAELSNGDEYKHDTEAMALKMVGLELTNGHSIAHGNEEKEYLVDEMPVDHD